MNPRVCTHPANRAGRDFIVGDLHGHPDALQILLDRVAFDEDTDRLFSVGDLVDRGPNSAKALDLLDEPWFHPVLGNHDAMLLATLNLEHVREMRREEAQRTAAYADLFARNGGWDWLRHFRREEDRCEQWRSALSRLPLVRIVDPMDTSPAGRFHVLHAELAAEQGAGVAVLWNDADLDDAEHPRWREAHPIIGYDAVGTWEEHILWGREIRYALTHDVPIVPAGLSRTYVGHTITPPRRGALLQVAGHVFLDTGAAHLDPTERYRDQGLTLFCHPEERGWMLTVSGIQEVRLNPPSMGRHKEW
ncbi:metallophosphoesterase [Acidithiobacillus sp.]|uniref:metallophosphoesterase n=1 Tax=Acidithiobacillus sp. TaxID=1872118 RepID=UPI0025BD2FC5|nr:metallophosphoesterase [Acidithiobacillus sp.]